MLKAKRKLLRWYRYLDKTNSRCSNRRNAELHNGYIDAYWDVTYAHTWAPRGIRTPWSFTLWETK